MLIAARSDRGTPRVAKQELDAFCKQRGIKAYLPTSAKAGEGIEELIANHFHLFHFVSIAESLRGRRCSRCQTFGNLA